MARRLDLERSSWYKVAIGSVIRMKAMRSAEPINGKKSHLGTVAVGRLALTQIVLAALQFVLVQPSRAQTLTVLHNFTATDGRFPQAGLTPDGKGNFYGTTEVGGANGEGTIFQLSPGGSEGWNENVIYSFCPRAPICVDGAGPYFSGVTLDGQGNLYGTTCCGGLGPSDSPFNGANLGTVWELSPTGASWRESVLYSFDSLSAGNAFPVGSLIMDSAGNFYGTALNNDGGPDAVFELSMSRSGWTEQVIYSFRGDGNNGLAMDSNGNIFGSTISTVFELSPNGSGGWTPTVVYNFNKDVVVTGSPVFDSAGNLYVATFQGGAYRNGSVVKLSPKKKGGWRFEPLYAFSGCPSNYAGPVAGVVVDSLGNVYGTTPYGGNGCSSRGMLGYGTVFELVAPLYTEKVLWNFSGTDGANPYAPLTLDSSGNLYGTTEYGGSDGYGVVFELTP